MDKYEYRIRAEEINALIDKKKFVEAVKIADTIDWRRVKSVMMLCKISELYKINRRYEDSKEILLMAYERNPGSRKIIYSLCELSIKLEETVQAVEYYKEFVQIAPRDTGKFILQYRLYEAQDVSLEERIAVLEEYKKRDYREKWAYELAYLYHRIGLATRCVEECDELILWFGEGKYVIKAMELKMLHCPLTASQQEKYDRRFQTQEPVSEEREEPETEQKTEDSALPIEIKAVEPSNAPTTKIPSKSLDEHLKEEIEETKVGEPEVDTHNQPVEEEPEAVQEEAPEEEQAKESDEVPITQPDDDLDIKVKTIDVDNEYSTMNLQQELAKSLAKFMAEEDMVASDATMAMPFATLAEAATSDTIMGAITDDSIKNAIIAPLLQDTAELTPITEEDLLASMEENKESQPPEETEKIEKKPSKEDILTAEIIQIPTSVQKTRLPVPAEQMAEEKPDEITEQFVKALEEEAVAIMPVGQEKPVEELIHSSFAQPEQLVEELVQSVPAEPEQPAEELVQNIPQEPEQPIEEIVQSIPKEPAPLVEAPVQPVSKEPERMQEPPVTESRSEYSEPEENSDDGQITGQLSLEDIMAEWEETKRASEERRMQEMRERVIQQTGPMFSNFDAMARASVQADLDLISPAEDVFKHDNPDEEAKQQEKPVEEPVEKTVTEEIKEEASEKPEQTASVTFDTAEIYGLEEKLLDALNSPEIKEQPAPVEPIAIDSSFFEDTKEESAEPELAAAEIKSEPVQELMPAAEIPLKVPVPEPVSVPIEVSPEVPVQETRAVEEILQEAPAQESVTAAANEPLLETPSEALIQEPIAKASEAPAQEPIAVAPAAIEAPIEIPIPDVSIGKPVDLQSTDFLQTFVPKDDAPMRSLTKEEKSRFASFAPNKEEQGKIAKALDVMKLSAATGNMLITGEHGTGTLQAAQNVVVQLKEKYPEFSGKMAKITGELLAEKNIGATLENLENSALLIERAGDLPADALGNLLFHLDRLKEHKVFVIMEDTKKEIERLTLLYPDIAAKFNARIDIQSLDNDGLVNYAREYAKEQEYAIDDLGILALYTKISDMQTIEHAVTVEEVKEMVDKAIVHAEKKSVSHFMDIILAKRYDGDDMIILREKDFLN